MKTFTPDDVIKYRAQYDSMKATGAKPATFLHMIARRHGCTYANVYWMVTRRTYKDVISPPSEPG